MKTISICACASRTFISKANVAKLAAAAECSGWEVNIIPDLCELCANHDSKVLEIAEGLVAACHNRAVKSLLDFCDTSSEKILNIRTTDIDQNIKEIGIDIETIDKECFENAIAKYTEILKNMPNKWGEDAWYPTIDKDVCVECGKCYDFCPFGVYEMIEGRVRVMHPHSCKNNCPACARNCPACAIIFPKYDHSPINGGEAKEESAIQLDAKEIYNTALKERLAARRESVLRKNGEK